MTTEQERTNQVRDQGQPDGLFRGCMDVIRHSHSVGQSLRTAALAAGLMTDKNCYAELLDQFYLTTAALEVRLHERKDHSSAIAAIIKLGYAFTKGYEQDLLSLLGADNLSDVPSLAREIATEPARDYVRRISSCTDIELVAAAFILWGPLVIGGGAALKPRVRKSFGEEATHVFADVVGVGRGDRRKEFIHCMDEIGEGMGEEDKNQVVAAAGEFMQLNNDMMLAVKRSPWWSKYVWGGVAVVAAAAAATWYRKVEQK